MNETRAHGKPAGDTFTIYAEDGEYQELALDIGQALAQFRARRPGCFVSAVVNDGMRPRLVIADEPEAGRCTYDAACPVHTDATHLTETATVPKAQADYALRHGYGR